MFAGMRTAVLGLSLMAGLASAALAQDQAADSISGRVVYDGTPPTRKKINPSTDPHCMEMHANDPLMEDSLVVGEDGGVRYVFVEVVGGLPKGKTYDPPPTPVTLDQRGCMYAPHVIGVQAGQSIEVVNDDDTNHNVHGMPRANKVFNKGQAKRGMRDDFMMTQPEIFRIRCDVHGWMDGWFYGADNPYYAVTEKDGSFKLTDVPPGSYTVEVWHEKLGKSTQKVTVKAKEDAKVNFEMAGK